MTEQRPSKPALSWLLERAKWLDNEMRNGGNLEHIRPRYEECMYIHNRIGALLPDEPKACNHGAISPKGTMFYHGFVDPRVNIWRCGVCKGLYEGNLTEPNTLGSQALTLIGPAEPPSELQDDWVCMHGHQITAAGLLKIRRMEKRLADEPSAPLTKCPYCEKPAYSDGSIYHVGGCRGLDDIKMTRLQYDALVARLAVPPPATHARQIDVLNAIYKILRPHFGIKATDEMAVEIMKEIHDRTAVTKGTAEPPAVTVGGNSLPTTLAQFELRASRLLEDEQRKISPDNALIGFLCDAVRIARENERMAKSGLAQPPDAFRPGDKVRVKRGEAVREVIEKCGQYKITLASGSGFTLVREDELELVERASVTKSGSLQEVEAT